MTFYVGIDTGKNTGLAVWDSEKKRFDLIKPCDFHDCIYAIVGNYPPRYTVIRVELSQTKAVWHKGKRTDMKKNNTIAVNVGMVRRESELMLEMLTMAGYKVIPVKPSGKIDANVFEKITGYKGRTNQHTRDAAMMVYGMNTLPLDDEFDYTPKGLFARLS